MTAAKVVPLRRAGKCPICGKPAIRAYHPFCSKRHADEDLGRWLTGKYAIPAVEAEQEGETEADDGER